MKKAVLAIACAVLGFGLTAANATASTLAYQGDYYVGYYYPPGAEEGYINTLIDLPIRPVDNNGLAVETTIAGTTYYHYAGDDLPDATAGEVVGHNQAIDVSPNTYVVVKYDGNNAGNLVWYVGADGLTIDLGGLPENWPLDTKWTLNQVTLYPSVPQSVPDGGMTLMLLGGALIGLEALRRRSKA